MNRAEATKPPAQDEAPASEDQAAHSQEPDVGPHEDADLDPSLAATMGFTSFGAALPPHRNGSGGGSQNNASSPSGTLSKKRKLETVLPLARSAGSAVSVVPGALELEHEQRPGVPKGGEAQLDIARAVYFKDSFLEDPWRDCQPRRWQGQL